ncbi:MAG: thiolase family protein [Thermoplasmataceae archaeon]
MVSIVLASFTKFGKRDDDLLSIASQSADPIVDKYREDIDFFIVSNSYSGEYNGISGLNNLLTTRFSIDGIPSLRIDNTSGSGGSAVLVASSLIESGIAKNVLVTGAEKMTGGNGKTSTAIIASLLHSEEKRAGISLPSLGGLLTKIYMEEFGASRESIAMVAVKNHENGSRNPYAQFQKPVTLEEVMNSKVIADPLRIFEFCPVSDGSASLLLTSDDNAESFSSKSAKILGCASASGSSSLSARDPLTTIVSVKNASGKAFRSAGLKPSQMNFAELHDMSTILEIVESEDAGFFKKGEGWKALVDHTTDLHGEMPINTSGGLNSKGHPIGASGVAQAGEAFLQLTGGAGQRQVKNAEYGFSLSMAGFGNCSTAFVYGVN